MYYKHTHLGYLAIVTGGIALLFSLGMPWTLVGIAISVACVVLFPIQTIEVCEDRVVWHLGLGLIRKEVPFAEIESVAPAMNTWSWTWDPRHVARYFLFLMCGVDAVELELRSGRTILLCTDKAEDLAGAIETLRLRLPLEQVHAMAHPAEYTETR